MHQEGTTPRASWRRRLRDRRILGVETTIATLETEWHRAQRDAPDEALAAALALADALVDAGRQRAAAGVLARASRGASDADPALPHVGFRLGELAFSIGRLDDARRGYGYAVDAGVDNARARARHGVFLAASGNQRQAIRQFSAALLEPDGPGEIATAAQVLLHAAETARDENATMWARGALEGFRVVHDDENATRAQQLVAELRELMPEQWSAAATGEQPAVGPDALRW